PEFMKFSDYAPRLRGKPQAAEQSHGRLDADHDGKVSMDEYIRGGQRLLAAAPAGAAKPAPAPAPEAKPSPAEGNRPVAADGPIPSEQLTFFEAKIRPVLIEHCYKCHSATSEKIRGNFVLDTRAGIRKGGDLGEALIPGNLDESLLIQAIRYKDEDLQMPPK